LQAEVSANAEKAAWSQQLKACDLKEIALAFSVLLLKCVELRDLKNREGDLMKSKVVLITGALTGIGRAAVCPSQWMEECWRTNSQAREGPLDCAESGDD
jgi:hypothetical protein